MIEIDLITGFLGAGKTTFIREYAKAYMDRGVKVCILENDFGAVNIDMLLLNDLYAKGCGLEMLAGACDPDCHKRRLKTKLIAMRMFGYQRVIIEPSGIYDTEEFFDVLREEPLDEWYHIDNVIALVNANLDKELSGESEYLLATQLCSAGSVVLSRTDTVSLEEQKQTVEYLNNILERHKSSLRLEAERITGKSYRERFEELTACGYRTEALPKLWFDKNDTYDSVYFMNLFMTEEKLRTAIVNVFEDNACGKVVRVKGLVKEPDSDRFLQINATAREMELEVSSGGQQVLIVIGEGLQRDKLSAYMGKEADTL